jgi:hypothetical protein
MTDDELMAGLPPKTRGDLRLVMSLSALRAIPCPLAKWTEEERDAVKALEPRTYRTLERVAEGIEYESHLAIVRAVGKHVR